MWLTHRVRLVILHAYKVQINISNMVLSPTGTRGFGITLVNGFNLVPLPPARMMALKRVSSSSMPTEIDRRPSETDPSFSPLRLTDHVCLGPAQSRLCPRHAGDIQDRDGARLVLDRISQRFGRLRLIWADGGYAGQLVDWVKKAYHRTLEIVKRSDDLSRFVMLPKRWIVERTFSWLYRYRRLNKDYELLPENSEPMILIAVINLMSRRLAHGCVKQDL